MDGGAAPPPLTDSSAFLAGTAGRTFVVRLDTPAAQLLFGTPAAAAAGYRVVLRVSASQSATGYSAVKLSLPAPPSGGTCRADPTFGRALQTRFEVRCAGWTADSLPLAYAFSSRYAQQGGGAADSGPSDPSLSWSPSTAVESYGMYLPAGNYTLAAAIFDAVGSRAVMDAIGSPVHARVPLSVSGADGAASAAAVGALIDSLGLVGAIGPALSVLDAVGDSVNSAVPSVMQGSRRCGRGRRLLASSSAYRMAMRRLLLRKLAGISSGGGRSTSTAPSLLRTARHAAAIPVEMSTNGPDDGAAALTASLAVVDLVSVRMPATLPDASKLALSILEAAGVAAPPNSENGQPASDSLAPAVAAALLGAAGIYALGMVDGEIPMTIQASAGTKSVGLHAFRGGPIPSVNGATANFGLAASTAVMRRSSNDPLPPAGISVVRLTSQFGDAANSEDGPVLGMDDKPGTPLADVVGVLVTPNKVKAGELRTSPWMCQGDEWACVRITVIVTWTGGVQPAEAVYVCQRWTEGEWNATGCAVSSTDGVSDTQKAEGFNLSAASVAITCKCESDGIFTVSANAVPATAADLRPSPDFVLAFRPGPYHSRNAAAVLGTVCAALVATFAVLVLVARSRLLKYVAPVETKRLPSRRKRVDFASHEDHVYDSELPTVDQATSASAFFDQKPFVLTHRPPCRRQPFLFEITESVQAKVVASASTGEPAAEEGNPLREFSFDFSQSACSEEANVVADLVFLTPNGKTLPVEIPGNLDKSPFQPSKAIPAHTGHAVPAVPFKLLRASTKITSPAGLAHDGIVQAAPAPSDTSVSLRAISKLSVIPQSPLQVQALHSTELLQQPSSWQPDCLPPPPPPPTPRNTELPADVLSSPQIKDVAEANIKAQKQAALASLHVPVFECWEPESRSWKRASSPARAVTPVETVEWSTKDGDLLQNLTNEEMSKVVKGILDVQEKVTMASQQQHVISLESAQLPPKGGLDEQQAAMLGVVLSDSLVNICAELSPALKPDENTAPNYSCSQNEAQAGHVENQQHQTGAAHQQHTGPTYANASPSKQQIGPTSSGAIGAIHGQQQEALNPCGELYCAPQQLSILPSKGTVFRSREAYNPPE